MRKQKLNKGDLIKIKHRKVIRLFYVAAFILSLLVCSSAQTKKSKPRWNWQEHETEAIDCAKKYPISNLDPKLPLKSFEEWFQSLFDDSAQTDWQVNDCGEQSGTRADRGRDFPMCVSAETQTGEFFYISVNIQFGRFSDGVSREKPFLRSIMVGDQLDGEIFYVLSDLPEKIKSNRSKRQYLDPNGGVFVISAESSAIFNDLTGMWLQTMAKNAANKYVAVPPNGGIEVGEKAYSMREVRFDGKNLSFETVKLGGVNLKFEGEFAKLKFDSDGEVLGENILEGRLTKFVKGRKAATAKLVFSFIFKRNKATAIPNNNLR